MIYDIAGLRISIENRCKYTEHFCKGYLSEDQSSPVDLHTKVTDEEFYAEKNFSPNFPDGYIENICLYRGICRQLPVLNRLLLHSAVLSIHGEGYAFLGRSGTGKSTHTGLWIKHLKDVHIVNGDKPILEYKDGAFIAYGTPWNGKEGLGENTSAQLKGLCFLEQAKENSINRLSPSEASARVLGQILFPSDEANAGKTLELADKLITETPCWLLRCDISETAVKTSFEAMTGKEYEQAKK